MPVYRQPRVIAVLLLVAVTTLIQTVFANLHLTEERALRDWILMVMIPSAILSWRGVYFSSNSYLCGELARLVDEHGAGTPEEFKSWMRAKLLGDSEVKKEQ
jgi:hypothetical protein